MAAENTTPTATANCLGAPAPQTGPVARPSRRGAARSQAATPDIATAPSGDTPAPACAHTMERQYSAGAIGDTAATESHAAAWRRAGPWRHTHGWSHVEAEAKVGEQAHRHPPPLGLLLVGQRRQQHRHHKRLRGHRPHHAAIHGVGKLEQGAHHAGGALVDARRRGGAAARACGGAVLQVCARGGAAVGGSQQAVELAAGHQSLGVVAAAHQRRADVHVRQRALAGEAPQLGVHAGAGDVSRVEEVNAVVGEGDAQLHQGARHLDAEAARGVEGRGGGRRRVGCWAAREKRGDGQQHARWYHSRAGAARKHHHPAGGRWSRRQRRSSGEWRRGSAASCFTCWTGLKR